MSGDLCVICRDTLGVGCDSRTLSCEHVFHTECISDWCTVGGSSSCPLCHAEIPSRRALEIAPLTLQRVLLTYFILLLWFRSLYDTALSTFVIVVLETLTSMHLTSFLAGLVGLMFTVFGTIALKGSEIKVVNRIL